MIEGQLEHAREAGEKGVLRATLIGRSYAVTASEIERYRKEHLGQRTGFHDPAHPFHGKRGGGGGAKTSKNRIESIGSIFRTP